MAETLDAGDLDRLAALEQRATPGEWWTDHQHTIAGEDQTPILCHELCGLGRPWTRIPDADLIVALRNASPALVALARAGLAAQAEVARLRRALGDIARVHQAYQVSEDSPSALAYLEFAGEVGTILRAAIREGLPDAE